LNRLIIAGILDRPIGWTVSMNFKTSNGSMDTFEYQSETRLIDLWLYGLSANGIKEDCSFKDAPMDPT